MKTISALILTLAFSIPAYSQNYTRYTEQEILNGIYSPTNGAILVTLGGLSPVGSTLVSSYVWVGSDISTAIAVAITGDITMSDDGVVAIGSGKVTNAMLAGSIAPAKITGTAAILGANTFTDMQTGTYITLTGGIGAVTATYSGAITAATLNTGQGYGELYLMDQNVRQADSPTFSYLTLTNGISAVTATYSGAITATTLDTGNGAAELFLMDQNVRQADSPTFSYLTATNGISAVTATLSGAMTVGGTLGVTGAFTAPTINTGQGVTEVFLMNQNIASTDSPTFAGLTLNGFGTLYSRTQAELLAITPTVVGQTAFCSDCVPAKVVVSTGTALWGEWADAVGGVFK